MRRALAKEEIVACRFGFLVSRTDGFFIRLALADFGGFGFRFKSIKCCWQPSFFNATTLLFIKFNEFIWIRALARVRSGKWPKPAVWREQGGGARRGEGGKEAKGNAARDLSKSGRFADDNFKRLEIEASLQANWQRSESNQARFFECSTRYPPPLPPPPSPCLAHATANDRQLSTFNLQLAAAMRLIQLGSLISALLADKLPPLFFFDVRYFLSRTVANEQHSTLSQSNHIRDETPLQWGNTI